MSFVPVCEDLHWLVLVVQVTTDVRPEFVSAGVLQQQVDSSVCQEELVQSDHVGTHCGDDVRLVTVRLAAALVQNLQCIETNNRTSVTTM